MKNLWLLFFLCFVSPAIFAQSDLRLFGTNLFDFSPLTSASVNVPYHIQGKVSHIYSSSIRITCDVGVGFVYSPPSWGEIQNSTPGDLLSQLYVQQRAEKGDIGVGEMLSMGPNARQYLKPVEKTLDFYLLNYPFETQVGASVDCLALPTTTKNLWDYGKPFSGDLSKFKVIYRVQPTGIIAERQYSPEEKKAMKQAIDARTVAWLFSQATNGSASAQCSLGLHYLSGQGVETNKTLAIEWLKRAADQGDIEASNKLEELTAAQILNQN
jgi:hypothetical protein